MQNLVRLVLFSSFSLLVFINSIFANPVVRNVAGINSADIQATVDQFRADLGGVNNPNNGQSFTTGRREINWDGVPDNFSAPNFMPNDFFNVNSPRGAVFTATTPFDNNSAFQVSADDNNPTNTAVRFANIDPSYALLFRTFSPQRLFIARNTTTLGVDFFIPGTKIPATVSGFGVVFCDVDDSQNSYIKLYGPDNRLLGTFNAMPSIGLSFVGVSFNAGERIARVEIVAGNTPLGTGVFDGVSGTDVTALDDFIYGEPRAVQFHPQDFDGDGFADATIFRPSEGTFFVFNSGSNTVSFIPFGQVGDIPVNGDFDGDSRADVAIFRRTVGEWWINQSSTGQTVVTRFGQNGDRPVPGDFDKDGKTDIVVWRREIGTYFVLRSKDGSFFSFPFGEFGDIPVGSALIP